MGTMEYMDWDEFEERGAMRRYNRYPQRTDTVSVVLGVILVVLIITWVIASR